MTKQQQKDEAWRRYDETIAPANKLYEETVAPAWKLRNETIDPARKLYQAKIKEINEPDIIEVDGKRYQLIDPTSI